MFRCTVCVCESYHFLLFLVDVLINTKTQWQCCARVSVLCLSATHIKAMYIKSSFVSDQIQFTQIEVEGHGKETFI